MSKKYGELAQQLRQVFNDSPDQYLTSQTLYERMGAADPGQRQERESIRDTLPWLLRCGFLVKQGRGMTASFKASGQGMKRQRMTEEQLQERRRERAALRSQRERAARLQRTRAARVGVKAANTPAPATVKADIPAETVEQFLARGGRVQRLTAHWEQMERAA